MINDPVLDRIKRQAKEIGKKAPFKIKHSLLCEGVARALGFAHWHALSKTIANGNLMAVKHTGRINASPNHPTFRAAMNRLCNTIGVSYDVGALSFTVPLGRLIRSMPSCSVSKRVPPLTDPGDNDTKPDLVQIDLETCSNTPMNSWSANNGPIFNGIDVKVAVKMRKVLSVMK